MARRFLNVKTLALAAAVGTSALAGIATSNSASAFGFHGGGFGGFHGGGFGGGFHGGGFGGFRGGFGGFHGGGFGGFHPGGFHRIGGFGGFHRIGFGFHPRPFPIVGNHPIFHPRPWPPRNPNPFPRPIPFPVGCHFHHHHLCGGGWGGGYGFAGPVYAPAYVTLADNVSVDYFYGDRPIYYRERLVHSFASCVNEIGTYVLISFVPSATSADVSAFLQTYKAVIIDGPGQDSIYVLKLADQKMSEQDVQAELRDMQAATSVVRFISTQGGASASN